MTGLGIARSLAEIAAEVVVTIVVTELDHLTEITVIVAKTAVR